MSGRAKVNRKAKLIIAALLLLGIAFGAGYYSKPDNVKEVVKYKEAKDIVIIKTRYVYPDGTIKEQEVTKDKSTTELDKVVESSKGLGVRVSVYTLLNASDSYGVQIHSPPVISIFKSRLGLTAGAETINGNINSNVGVYVQF